MAFNESIHGHSCFKKGTLPARNVSPLMPINCLVNCPINRRVKEIKSQRDKKKKGQRQKPFNGSAMNSPPTPPYCGSVAAALHLMNVQIRCGSCREKVYGVFYKLRDKERSKDSAYVFNLIFRTPLISVYRLAMDANRQGDDVAG